MKLYEIASYFKNFLEDFEDNLINEEIFDEEISEMSCLFNEKADNIACFIKNLKSESNEINIEIKNLQKRMNQKNKTIEFMKNYLKNAMQTLEIDRIETSRNKILIKNNPESLDFTGDFVLWAQKNYDELLKYETPKPDKLKIKELLKLGKEIPHVKIIKNKRISII